MSLTTPTAIGNLQRKLYVAAKAQPDRRFHQLYDKVYREDILEHAYRLARQADGAPGVDGESFEAIEAQGEGEWVARLGAELRSQRYQPRAVRRVMIPKPGGGERPLGIPTIRDRVVQGAARVVLEPIFEADFMDCAYGYRPKRRARDAVQKVHAALREGYTEVVDADLSKYFDLIPHDELVQCVARRVVDRPMLRLIKRWLKVEVEERDAQGKRKRSGGKGSRSGTPQGGVISPLLANIHMHRFLKAWRDHGKAEQLRARLVNYADDFVILSRGQAQAALDWTRRIMSRIGLTINEQKTGIREARREPFIFLGYRFGPMIHQRTGRRHLGAAPSKQAIQRLRERVRTILQHANKQPWPKVVEELNQTLRGWQNYFSYGSVSRAYEAVNWMVLEKARRFLRERHKGKTATVWKQIPARTLYGAYGIYKVRRSRVVSAPCAVT